MVLLRGFELLSSWLLPLLLLSSHAAVRTEEAREPPLVIGSGAPIRAAPGDDTVLPCHLEPKYDVEGLTVEWSKPDLEADPAQRLSRVEYVHLYRDRREVPDMKIRSYLWRTQLFTDDLKDGNISLKLKNVTLADQGTYRCFIPKLKSPVTASIVQLVVAPQSNQSFVGDKPKDAVTLPKPEDHDETDAAGGRLHLIVVIPLVVLLVILVAVAACLFIRKSEKQKYAAASTSPLTA
ncbi:myelin-oligodendrocyte glycoprotein-like [Clinocottus analis]|uniref:myelin-oligodendrocyte glycoprotein-like n=1 Tax=Clinocottus analis TaxID=304258 RepID=UPI0035BEDB37